MKMNSIRSIFFIVVTVLFFVNIAICEDRLIIKDGSTETFKVDQTGKVYTDSKIGIGTENPQRSIHINGSNSAVRIDRNEDAAAFQLVRTNIDGSVIKCFSFGLSASSASNSTFQIRDYGTATGGAVYKNRLLIDGDGNIGIGTDNPAGKLDVNGSIYQRGSRIHADYVFDKEYDLEDIEDHADYMWTNKHLPAVAKARIDKNGEEIVEIGAQRRGILEELEKAHIYIEQLNQRIKKLETRLSKQ